MTRGGRCEWDGMLLTFTPEGLEEACSTCEEDIQLHFTRCAACRLAPSIPEDREALE